MYIHRHIYIHTHTHTQSQLLLISQFLHNLKYIVSSGSAVSEPKKLC